MSQYLISLGLILILASDLCRGVLNGLFLSGFVTKILYVFTRDILRAICSPAHPSQVDHPNDVG
jgi:hypothetical protein